MVINFLLTDFDFGKSCRYRNNVGFPNLGVVTEVNKEGKYNESFIYRRYR